MNRLVCAALVVLVAGAASAEDRVKLRSGKVLVGEVESQDDNVVVLRTSSGVLRLPRKQVVSIEIAQDEPRPTPKGKDADAAKDEAEKPGADAGRKVETPPADKPAGKQAEGAPAVDEAWNAKVLGELAHKTAKKRAGAAQAIVDAWPASAAALDRALTSSDRAVRLEAVRLLGRKELGDTQARIRRSMTDANPAVRQMAARAVRTRGFAMEKDLIPLVRADAEARVVLEAMRALEDVGSWRCYRTLYDRWNAEFDKELKRRYRRNMKRILGEDHGDDAQAWLAAIQAAAEEARTKPK